jgi:hypothetical protein
MFRQEGFRRRLTVQGWLFATLAAMFAIGVACSHGAAAQRPGVFEANFTARSYAPGQRAQLRVRNGSSRLTVQLFRAGAEQGRTRGKSLLRGVPMESARSVRLRPAKGWTTVRIRLQYWPSGLYFARLRNQRGQVYFATFILRAANNLRGRVAVVMPTNTWQAYNFRDDDDDGVPNTWYANESVTTVDLNRPYLDRGVPPHFRQYDLGFLRWLVLTGKSPDFYADDDLEQLRARDLVARYDLIVFPGHHEYVTTREYNAIEGYYRAGGNLMFLTANNFFRRVVRTGSSITRTEKWRELGRPEAGWMGVQYLDWYQEKYENQPFLVVGAEHAPWLFKNTGLRNGKRFGLFGIEIDTRTADSPPGTQVLATIPNIFGQGKSAEMVFHTTPAGAKVFSAGAMTLAGGALVPPMREMIKNLWEELSQP